MTIRQLTRCFLGSTKLDLHDLNGTHVYNGPISYWSRLVQDKFPDAYYANYEVSLAQIENDTLRVVIERPR